jgi:L-ribulose-5-phosphate 3-epimerase
LERIVAVNTNCYHGYSIEEAVAGIRRAGFRYVELTATKGWTEHVFPDQSFAHLCDVKALLRDNGLVPFSMSGHVNLMDEQRLPDFVRNMDLAAFYGCRYIVSSIGEAHLKNRTETGPETAAAHIRSLLPALEAHGLLLVLELHGEYATGAAMEQIVQKVDSPLVRINYDTANCIFYGNVLPEEDIDTCMADVAYLHVKDKAGAANEWNFPALGEGYVNFPKLFEKLARAGNSAPFSVEIEFTKEGAGSLEAVDRAVEVSGRYLRQAGFTL